MFQGGDADLQSACDGFNSHCFHQKYYKIYNNLQKFTRKNALIRQLGDYNPYKVMAIGSSPIQSTISGCSLVGRTLVLGTRGRRFNSFHSDQKKCSGVGTGIRDGLKIRCPLWIESSNLSRSTKKCCISLMVKRYVAIV